jgi:hypothetical protein
VANVIQIVDRERLPAAKRRDVRLKPTALEQQLGRLSFRLVVRCVNWQRGSFVDRQHNDDVRQTSAGGTTSSDSSYSGSLQMSWSFLMTSFRGLGGMPS